MNYGQPNATAATGTKNRVDSVPYSGLCSVCLDGCPGLCEVGKSSFRGREVIYPEPYGKTTAGATKAYPVDYSHINIQGTCVGANGVEADPDQALFTNATTDTTIGADGQVKLKVPVFTGGLGSSEIARANWEGIAVGSALSGIMLIIGENIVGMDPDATFKGGKVTKSPELERRVKLFKDWYDGHGAIVLQQNVEDGRLGSPEYAVEKLGVECLELKWGQGAKNIGGEVKLNTMERAIELKNRGYLVAPDPDDHTVQSAYKDKALKQFERHSRLGMVEYDSFMASVEHCRKIGAKYVSLKTGAYRVSDLARAIRYASDAKLDLLTIDGAGGGTGMSPWRMMNEWGIPTIYLQSLTYQFCEELKKKKKFVPHIAMAGGFSLEDHVFKSIAMGAPYTKAVCMGRATMIPALVGKNIEEWVKKDKVPANVKKYGTTMEEIFLSYEEVKNMVGSKAIKKVPGGAIAMHAYCDRLKVGLQQLMAGARKFRLDLINRDDLVALTKESAEVTGLPYVMESDMDAARKILLG